MKKFFMAGTDDEVQFGDVIELDMVKELKSGKVKHQRMECKFSPLIVEMLLESEVIEEREIEDEETEDESLVEFNEGMEELLNDLSETQEELEKRIEELESNLEAQDKKIDSMMKALKACIAKIDGFIKNDKQPNPLKKK